MLTAHGGNICLHPVGYCSFIPVFTFCFIWFLFEEKFKPPAHFVLLVMCATESNTNHPQWKLSSILSGREDKRQKVQQPNPL